MQSRAELWAVPRTGLRFVLYGTLALMLGGLVGGVMAVEGSPIVAEIVGLAALVVIELGLARWHQMPAAAPGRVPAIVARITNLGLVACGLGAIALYHAGQIMHFGLVFALALATYLVHLISFDLSLHYVVKGFGRADLLRYTTIDLVSDVALALGIVLGLAAQEPWVPALVGFFALLTRTALSFIVIASVRDELGRQPSIADSF